MVHSQHSGVLGDIVQSSSVILKSIGDKFKDLKQKATGEFAAIGEFDQSLARTRALQSTRIKLRLLAHESRYEEIAQIAEATTEDDIANLAIMQLLEADCDKLPLLRRIADGFSCSSILALIALVNLGDADYARRLFFQRLNGGDLEMLISSGTIQMLPVLDLLTLSSFSTEQIAALSHFENLYKSQTRPEQKLKVLAEILNDPEPGGFRYVSDVTRLPQSIKLRAIEHVFEFHPIDRERPLFYASTDTDDLVSYRATTALIEYWQTEQGKVPAELEPYPMLDLNMLFYLTWLSSSFEWGEAAQGQERYAELQSQIKAMEELDRAEQAYEFDQLKYSIEQMKKEVMKITDRRVNALQPLINQICQVLNLPYAKCGSTDQDVAALYLIGEGKVLFSPSVLMEEKPLSEEVMSTLLHELNHMEQDVLVIRMIADDLGLKFGEHAKLLMPLWERYAEGVGYAPDSIFLLAVLRLRDDRPLNAAERKRAMRLYENAKEAKVGHVQFEAVSARTKRIEKSHDLLLEGKYNAQLLTCLRETKGLTSLFQKGDVPAVLLHEIERCREDLHQIVESVHGSSSGWGKKNDVFALAQQMYGSNPEVTAVAERLKALLIQLLKEEHRRLSRARSDVRRAGYHEAEAYTISDRVEVIVKALRKGWYRC